MVIFKMKYGFKSLQNEIILPISLVFMACVRFVDLSSSQYNLLLQEHIETDHPTQMLA